ncbi:SGNH hydrolase-type esterase domain-containing protein [Rhexocercosporidium sp. MPI-PUGE-AT-0058]|nr:SGNH hydrolase-type esterase domain-containing protein [Rhexocercosporidium sp. MPI-PUGE-AT-0058]
MEDPHLPAYPPITRLASVTFPDGSCTAERQAAIAVEFQSALEMAAYTEAHLQEGVYYTTFFDQESRDVPNFAANTARVYGNIASMLQGGLGYKTTATCDGLTEYCSTTGLYAHIIDNAEGNAGRINFCENFWTDPRIVSTASIVDVCEIEVKDLRMVQRTRSALLLHEMTHTFFAMSFEDKMLDYAYGYTYCVQLATGNFDRSCMKTQMQINSTILCPDASGNEGTCLAVKSARNADSYTFVAAGVWYTSKCSGSIPLPDPVTKRSVGLRRAACPGNSDSIFLESYNPIGQYVHFGDSYGAGMGTGRTSTDKCRVGSNNFGRLLYRWINDESVEYVEKVCSGDSLTGLAGQIDTWSNPERASIGTLSIGGNDVGFSDLVWSCVITPNTAHLGSKDRADCVAAEKKATDYMADAGTTGLRYKLKEAYLSILRKSTQAHFHLYVTGYVNFFNEITTDCTDSSFHYWWSGYKPPSDWPTNRIVYLTTDLRSELNTLVTRLNTVIAGAISDANIEHGSTQIHFVDVEPSFSAGHRWCENSVGEYHEPDSSIADTWLFLSAWPDVSIEAAADTTAATEAVEVASLISSGGIPLPDAATCYASLGTDPDPYAYAMCQVSISISEDPTGLEAVRYRAAQAAIAGGDYSSQEIPGYVPTRQIKTFHPRSPGMVAYRDALLSVIAGVGQL